MEQTDDSRKCEAITAATVQAGADGDRSALLSIYDATSDRVYRLMVRMVGRQDADDLTQQVFLRAFAKLRQFSGDSKFETWLYRLATNEALQHLRREKHRQTRELLIEPTSDSVDHLDAEEQAKLVQHALGQLDPELRAILTLKEDSGLSYHEIAATLGIPEGTVGSRLNRARSALKMHLGQLGF